MRFSTASGAIALSALTISQARAEDVLYSRHLAKRDLNAEGNYNISQYHAQVNKVLKLKEA